MCERKRTTRLHLIALACICLLFAAMSTVGITWGLPSRNIDQYLFGTGEPWSGEKIYSLANAQEKFDLTRGADVDPDPLAKDSDGPILLTGSDEDVAKIYLRYRLYTYQPDEMITMMSLSGMSPGSLDFDPRLYQYGGLFIYPVGVLIKLCDVLGLIDVRSDAVYYLDNPDEFRKFYIVARAYSAAWGLLGVIVVFAIARRLGAGRGTTARRSQVMEAEWGATAKRSAAVPAADKPRPGVPDRATPLPNDGTSAGLLAALLFALMPVVVCMTHEAKPHLPGAVLMLAAVLFAMRRLDSRAAGFSLRGDASASVSQGATASRNAAMSAPINPRPGVPDRATPPASSGVGRVPPAETTDSPATGIAGSVRRDWLLMCICCGAAFGMVLSSWPIFVLIPLVAWMAGRQENTDAIAAGGTRPTTRFGIGRWLKETAFGTFVGVAVYVVTNPYVLINALFHPEVIESNLGNSFAMYDTARIFEGLLRVLELTVEGATLPILVVGVAALIVAMYGRKTLVLPLLVTAGIFFVQFVMIGAGKPGEYGRFGIFPNTALAIGTACLVATPINPLRATRWALGVLIVLWSGAGGYHYLANFRADTTPQASRLRARRALPTAPPTGTDLDPWTTFHHDIGLIAEPAPYSCPPLPFDTLRVQLFRDRDAALAAQKKDPARWLFFWTVDETDLTSKGPSMSSKQPAPSGLPEDKPDIARATPISWANKPIEIHGPVGPFAP